MEVKELEQELDDLKSKVEQHHAIIVMLMSSNTMLNKRMDMLETLTQALSALVTAVDKQLERHLELFRETGASPPSEPKAPKAVQQGIEVG